MWKWCYLLCSLNHANNCSITVEMNRPYFTFPALKKCLDLRRASLCNWKNALAYNFLSHYNKFPFQLVYIVSKGDSNAPVKTILPPRNYFNPWRTFTPKVCMNSIDGILQMKHNYRILERSRNRYRCHRWPVSNITS